MRRRRNRVLCVMVATAMVMMAAASAASAQKFTTLANFDVANGQSPTAALVQGLDGDLYGTTASGGLFSSGTVFKITPAGTLTTLYNFCSLPSCADGADPSAALVLGTDGNFYGTTVNGGSANEGTVFKITHAGVLTTLYSFCVQTGCADGANPLAPLLQGDDGNFYGTAAYGGTNEWGTIFKMTPQGTLTTVHAFDANTDGSNPFGGLVQGWNGEFYGTTVSGGGSGGGTIFSLDNAGSFAVLFTFGFGPTGEFPVAGLVQDANGNFYGTASYGGDYFFGTAFEITPWGSLTVLYMFTGGSDGSYPLALWEATDGNFYGTTESGGLFNNQCNNTNGCGTLFRISQQGTLTTLHSFCSRRNCADGNDPGAGLIQATDGNFYGTTGEGGSGSAGTVFSLSGGLGPFIETVPTAGRVSHSVYILGTDLKGTTSVTFNGMLASFIVESPTAVKATVPIGATTGPVQVVTPNRTLTSNVNFRVLP